MSEPAARAGVLSRQGDLPGRAEQLIDLNQPQPNHSEHGSEQIRTAVCTAVRDALAAADAEAARAD